MNENGPVALFDMDNTLFAYEQQLRADLKMIMSPGEELPVNLHDDSVLYWKARMDLIKSQPGWWQNLPKFELGWELYEVAQMLGFKCRILTKGPKSKPQAWAEKVVCVIQHCGSVPTIVGEDKSDTYGRVLVDDYPPYVAGWLEHRPRGLAIMPAHAYNAHFTHPQVIRYDGENLVQVRDALEAVYNRKDKENWQ